QNEDAISEESSDWALELSLTQPSTPLPMALSPSTTQSPYSSQVQETSPGVGISNFGNTCWMATVLQTIVGCLEWLRFAEIECTNENKMEEEEKKMAVALQKFIDNPEGSPRELWEQVKSIWPQYAQKGSRGVFKQ